jgi:hypothetical protein
MRRLRAETSTTPSRRQVGARAPPRGSTDFPIVGIGASAGGLDACRNLLDVQGGNLAPCFGLQFFGRVDIEGKSGVMTVTLKDVDNRSLWLVNIEPRPDARPGRSWRSTSDSKCGR